MTDKNPDPFWRASEESAKAKRPTNWPDAAISLIRWSAFVGIVALIVWMKTR